MGTLISCSYILLRGFAFKIRTFIKEYFHFVQYILLALVAIVVAW